MSYFCNSSFGEICDEKNKEGTSKENNSSYKLDGYIKLSDLNNNEGEIAYQEEAHQTGKNFPPVLQA